MTRDAKLYILENRDWRTLAETVAKHDNYRLQFGITILQLPHDHFQAEYYGIITLLDEIDKIVENYGGIIIDEKDILNIEIRNYTGRPLFGRIENIRLLK